MAKGERNFNPVAAQRKAEKQKEISKSKKQQQAQRNEKLARRNPERLQRQIDELKELESSGALRPKDKETLTQLERDLKGIKRARETLEIKDEPRRERRDPRQEQRERRQHLGKRRRDDDAGASGDETDPEVRAIPMPRDTPPPFPRQEFQDFQTGPGGQRVPHALPSKPVVEAPKTVYSSAPQIRNLAKEATKFMPSIVAQQKSRMKGQGRLLEPEELDRLEQSGYGAASRPKPGPGASDASNTPAPVGRASGSGGVDLDEEARQLEAEIQSLGASSTRRNVQMEEVEDAGT